MPGAGGGESVILELMFDWIGSLQIREHTGHRVVLGLSPVTRGTGVAAAALGGYGVWVLWGGSLLVSLLPAALLAFGLALTTLRRRLVFDRAAGTLVARQGVFGVGTQQVVPLFHLRAVVVMAKPGGLANRGRYVAYLDRRVGDSIYIDEARRCAGLLKMAEAIAEVAELRLEYDAGAA